MYGIVCFIDLCWENCRLANLWYLKNVEQYYNDLLKFRGYVFLSEIYEKLGFPLTKASIVVGWYRDMENPDVDNVIDFNLPDYDDSVEIDILVDFNVDGDITGHFK